MIIEELRLQNSRFSYKDNIRQGLIPEQDSGYGRTQVDRSNDPRFNPNASGQQEGDVWQEREIVEGEAAVNWKAVAEAAEELNDRLKIALGVTSVIIVGLIIFIFSRR